MLACRERNRGGGRLLEEVGERRCRVGGTESGAGRSSFTPPRLKAWGMPGAAALDRKGICATAAGRRRPRRCGELAGRGWRRASCVEDVERVRCIGAGRQLLLEAVRRRVRESRRGRKRRGPRSKQILIPRREEEEERAECTEVSRSSVQRLAQCVRLVGLCCTR
jgi:hypothetical protein